MITLLNKSSLRPSAYLCGLCVEIALLTQRTQRYAEDRRESLPTHVHDRALIRILFRLT